MSNVDWPDWLGALEVIMKKYCQENPNGEWIYYAQITWSELANKAVYVHWTSEGDEPSKPFGDDTTVDEVVVGCSHWTNSYLWLKDYNEGDKDRSSEIQALFENKLLTAGFKMNEGRADYTARTIDVLSLYLQYGPQDDLRQFAFDLEGQIKDGKVKVEWYDTPTVSNDDRIDKMVAISRWLVKNKFKTLNNYAELARVYTLFEDGWLKFK